MFRNVNEMTFSRFILVILFFSGFVSLSSDFRCSGSSTRYFYEGLI
jgi:hypothetical protein